MARREISDLRTIWRTRLIMASLYFDDLFCRLLQMGDEVVAIGFVGQTREGHFVSRDILVRVGQVCVERIGAPDDVGRAHCRRVVVARQRASMAAEQAVQVRSHFILFASLSL